MRILGLILSFLFSLAVLFVCGCATTSARTPVEMLSDGSIRVMGRPTAQDRIVEALRDAGVQPGSEIRVTVPADMPTETFRHIAARLAAGGYSRMSFIRPRQASATVKDRNSSQPK